MKSIIFILTLVLIPAINFSARAQSENQPTLRGDEAVKQLKQTGDYDSLKRAVKDARLKDGRSDNENVPDAVGQSAKLTASDGELGDSFGYSVAVSGDTAVVGVYLDDVGGNLNQGSAYVFVRSGTAWTQQAQLVAADGTVGDQAGWSVRISGDTVIVGAISDDIGGHTSQGSVYVFTRSGTTWTQQQKLTASDGAANDRFGENVAISGNFLIVGVFRSRVGGNAAQGAAYIYARVGTNWFEQQKLTTSGGAANDYFGYSVAISGDSLIVGAPGDDIGGISDVGSASVYTRSGATWTRQQKLTPSVGATGDGFGNSVAIDGDTAIIGAPNDNFGGNPNQGSIYVFNRSGTTWTEFQGLVALDGTRDTYFGSEISMSGNILVVGNTYYIVGTDTAQGSAYVFVRSGGLWNQELELTAADGAAGDSFGGAVAVSGSNIIVGARDDDIGANTGQGSAYAFRVLTDNWTREAKKVASDAAANDFFGESVSISGDTAVVGARGDDVSGNANQGSAYVFVRSGTVWTEQAQLFASDGAAGDSFGGSVAISGDTIIVGAYDDDVGANSNQGSAYIFQRNNNGVWNQQAHLHPTNNADDNFGSSVAIFGKTVVVGAYRNDITANADQGSAHVYVNDGSGWNLQQRLVASDGAAGDYFGSSVGIYADTVIVGAEHADIGANSNQGAAYAYLRSGTTWSEQQKLVAPTNGAANDNFGNSAAISGDTVIIGAIYNAVNGNSDQGSAHVFTRTGTTWTQQQRLLAANGAALDYFGASVSLDGDTAIVGANGRNSETGAAFVFERDGAAWTQKIRLSDTNGAAGDDFGIGVSISGDKIIVGSPYSNGAGANRPSSFGDKKSAFAPDAALQGAALFFVNALAPTAASVSIGGRVFASKGRGLANARVYLTDASGETRTGMTNAFGYYHFADVGVGQTIIITVVSKRYNFTPQVINIVEDISELNFISETFP